MVEYCGYNYPKLDTTHIALVSEFINNPLYPSNILENCTEMDCSADTCTQAGDVNVGCGQCDVCNACNNCDGCNNGCDANCDGSCDGGCNGCNGCNGCDGCENYDVGIVSCDNGCNINDSSCGSDCGIDVNNVSEALRKMKARIYQNVYTQKTWKALEYFYTHQP